MTDKKVITYIEIKPDHYEGEMSLTLRCKRREISSAKLLIDLIASFEGWEIIKDQEAMPAEHYVDVAMSQRDAQLAALREERDKLRAAGKILSDECDRLMKEGNTEISDLRADRDALAKALDWYSRNRDSVRYIAPHWYSGYIDEQSPNPNEWRSTGQWLTFRDAVSAAIRGGKQEGE